jgi:hypothetical protein
MPTTVKRQGFEFQLRLQLGKGRSWPKPCVLELVTAAVATRVEGAIEFKDSNVRLGK